MSDFRTIKTIDFSKLPQEYRYQLFEEYDRMSLWIPSFLFFRYPLRFSLWDTWYSQREIDKWIIENAKLNIEDEYVLIHMDH